MSFFKKAALSSAVVLAALSLPKVLTVPLTPRLTLVRMLPKQPTSLKFQTTN